MTQLFWGVFYGLVIGSSIGWGFGLFHGINLCKLNHHAHEMKVDGCESCEIYSHEQIEGAARLKH